MKTNFDDKEYWLAELMSNSDLIELFVKKAKEEDRLEGSKLIINVLRNFIESTMCYIAIVDGAYFCDNSSHKAVNKTSINYVKSRRNKYELLASIHDSINNSVSHESALVGDYAERLMLSYVPKLIRIKLFLYQNYGIVTIKNLKQFPLKLDESTVEYYKKIVETLKSNKPRAAVSESYYIIDKKEKYINGHSFFEYSLSVIDDSRSKGDKIIAFSNIDIFDNYAVKIRSYDEIINVFEVDTSIKIITEYEIAIRGCEFNKLGKIINVDANNFRYTDEYYRLMSFIKNERLSLSSIVRLQNNDFKIFSNKVFSSGRETLLKRIISTSRMHAKSLKRGTNVLLYLLASMENKTIERQICGLNDKRLAYSDLNLKSGVGPFDATPFCANLVNSSIDPKILFSTFDVGEHDFELVKREMDIYSNTNSLLYCPVDLFEGDTELDNKIQRLKNVTNNYSSFSINSAYDKQGKRYLYIEQNEKELVEIFTAIKSFINRETIIDYKNYAQTIIDSGVVNVDDDTKKTALVNMFDGKSLFAVYGPAGTGKSYLAKLSLSMLQNYSVLCVSSTHSSLENLKRRIGSNRGRFATVEQVARNAHDIYKGYDFVIVDECSTISNSNMHKLLQHISPKLILLMGDIYQIESIDFGNWFSLLMHFASSDSYAILDNCFRTEDESLKNLWQKVRDIEPGIHEHLKNYFISKPLNRDFFNEKNTDDRMVLCLNYGGLFGINNINAMLQSKNESKSFSFRQHIYKVGDPILFKDSYNNALYNNLKGSIIAIKESTDKMSFTLFAKDNLYIEQNNYFRDVKHVDNGTFLTIDVYKSSDVEIADDIKPNMVVPFNVAYASSIHKAQGLEFNRVDILISDEVKESISHNIFYTAITRAIKDLNIYWSPECEQKVIDTLSKKNYKSDEMILSLKYPHLKDNKHQK